MHLSLKRTSLFEFFKDEEVYLTESDKLLGFLPYKLSLQSGGCAGYLYPLDEGQNYTFVFPAKSLHDNSWVRLIAFQ